MIWIIYTFIRNMKEMIICSREAQNEALNTFYLSVYCQENVPDIDLFISVIYLFIC